MAETTSGRAVSKRTMSSAFASLANAMIGKLSLQTLAQQAAGRFGSVRKEPRHKGRTTTWTTAADKRLAAKRKNIARNRRAHRG